MLKKNAIWASQIIVVITIITSCVKDVDFEQADNFSLTPVLASTVLYTEVEASRFSENGVEIELVRDSIANIEIFGEEFVRDNLVKAELVFEATNTINRTFNLRVDFLNEADELQHTLSFDVLESSSGNAIVTDYIEIFEDDSLDALKLITKMVVTLTIYASSDGTMLNEDSTGKVSLKSKGIFYFNINV